MCHEETPGNPSGPAERCPGVTLWPVAQASRSQGWSRGRRLAVLGASLSAALKPFLGSSCCNPAVMRPTRIREDVGSIPGLAQ